MASQQTFTASEPFVAKESKLPPPAAPVEETKQDEELGLEVIVLNVHCAGEIPFVGNWTFPQHGEQMA